MFESVHPMQFSAGHGSVFGLLRAGSAADEPFDERLCRPEPAPQSAEAEGVYACMYLH